MTTELYAFKHNDITIQEDRMDRAKWLLVTVRNGKIGMRVANIGGRCRSVHSPTATLSGRDRKRLHLPSAESEPGNGSANLCTQV